MKTYEQFTDEQTAKFLAELEDNKDKPSLQFGDIVDINYDHVSRGSRIFAKVINVFKAGGIARVESIICFRIPYLCDHKFEFIVDAFDLSKKADMELFENKMKGTTTEVSENDPYAEEMWNDGDDFRDFEPWELKKEQFNTDDPYDEENWNDESEVTEYGDYQTKQQVEILKDIDVEIVYYLFDSETQEDEETNRDTLNLKKGDILNCDIISYDKIMTLEISITIDEEYGIMKLPEGYYDITNNRPMPIMDDDDED